MKGGDTINSIKKIVALAFFPVLSLLLSAREIIDESEWADKSDDIFFVIFGIIAIACMFFKGKKISFLSSVFLILALLTKIIAYFIESDDRKAVGPDYLIFIFIIIGIIISIFVQKRVQKGK